MIPKYPKNWEHIKAEIKARDLMKCALCGSNNILQVHHTRQEATLDNLITLCFVCHKNFANSYFGFKKRIREFNDLRLKNGSTKEEIEGKKEILIEDINLKIRRINGGKIMIKRKKHRTLDYF